MSVLSLLAWFALAVVATESLTEIIVHASILDRPRGWALRREGFLKELLTCPYCVSFWSAIVVVIPGFALLQDLPAWSSPFVVLAVHRMSNLIHGAVARSGDRSPRVHVIVLRKIDEDDNDLLDDDSGE